MTDHYGARGSPPYCGAYSRARSHSEFHVVECAGPAATRFADAAVFDVGGGESGSGESLAHRDGMQEVVANAPEASVNHDDQRGSLCLPRGGGNRRTDCPGSRSAGASRRHSVMRLTSRMCGLDD